MKGEELWQGWPCFGHNTVLKHVLNLFVLYFLKRFFIKQMVLTNHLWIVQDWFLPLGSRQFFLTFPFVFGSRFSPNKFPQQQQVGGTCRCLYHI